MCNGVCNGVGHNLARCGTSWHSVARRRRALPGPPRPDVRAGPALAQPRRHVEGGRVGAVRAQRRWSDRAPRCRPTSRSTATSGAARPSEGDQPAAHPWGELQPAGPSRGFDHVVPALGCEAEAGVGSAVDNELG